MEYFNYDFPVSGVMVGSMIPGVRVIVPPPKLATYATGEDHPLVKRGQPVIDPVARGQVFKSGTHGQPNRKPTNYPSMAGPHTGQHGFMEKLRSLLGGPQAPQMMEGYEAIRENRDWRVS